MAPPIKRGFTSPNVGYALLRLCQYLSLMDEPTEHIMAELRQELSDLCEIELALLGVIGSEADPAHLSVYHELLHEVQRQIQQIQSVLLEC